MRKFKINKYRWVYQQTSVDKIQVSKRISK